MPTDSSKFQRRSSRARKSVDTFILSYVNTQKSNHNAQIDVSDEREDSIVLEKSNHGRIGDSSTNSSWNCGFDRSRDNSRS